jgi:dipeptidyl aminopeptidase/acylaminoacyl peptidase
MTDERNHAPNENAMLGRIYSFDLSPDGSQLLVVADGSGRQQPWLIPAAEKTATDGTEARLMPVDGVALLCAWRPDGSRFVVQLDPDGRDEYQLAEVNPADGSVTPISVQPGVRNELSQPYATGIRPYSPDSRYLAFATNRRDRTCFDVVLRDLASGAERAILTAGTGVPEDRYFPAGFSWDSRSLLVLRLHQGTERDLYTVDLDTGKIRLLTPHEGIAKYFAVAARPEGIYLCATRDGNYTSLGLLSPDGDLSWIDAPEHDVDYATLSADGSTLAWSANQDGFTSMRYCEIRGGVPQEARQVTGLPRGAYAVEGGLFGFAPELSADGTELLLLADRPGLTPEMWRVDLASDLLSRIGPAGDTELTEDGEPAAALVPGIVRFTSADGTAVPALMYRPAGEGPFPVVVNIHGGPEMQAAPVSDPVTDSLVACGIAVLVPNIRGSSGYGVRYQRLIYRDWGGGDLADLRAAAEFLRAQPWIDQDRMAVYGASYGGFAALSCLTRLPEYWRAGVSECGVSDLVDDVRQSPPSWGRRMADWIGDISDPDDVRRLTQASPLTYADQVRAPVLLLHGADDANVSVDSSDMFYARLKELGKPVQYERVDGAGHAICQMTDTSSLVRDWLAEHLLAR